MKTYLIVGITFVSLISLLCLTNQTENTHAKIFENMMDKPAKELFKIFHALNEKSSEYDINSEEALKRYAFFKASLKEIKEHNANPANTYQLGVTPYSDRSLEEFSFYSPMKTNIDNITANKYQNLKVTYTPIDWTQKGALSANQFAINTKCPSFAYITAAAAMEAAYFIKTGQSINFSPQSLLDCGISGCNQYVDYTDLYSEIATVGLTTPALYPWTGIKGACKIFTNNVKLARFEASYLNINYSSTSDAIAILNRGPFIFQAGFSLRSNFAGGIFTPASGSSTCGSYYYNLLVVGYGIDATSKAEYWLVKGPYGASWGEKGYFRLARNDALVNYGINCFYSRPSL